MKRVLLIVGALASFAVAAVAFAVAADVSRWQSALEADDVRYRAAAEAPNLWQPDELLGRRVATRLLGIEDDVEFRHAVRTLRLGRIEGAYSGDPRQALLRTEALARLTAVVEQRGEAGRRAAARNLRGVLSLAASSSEYEDRDALLRGAVLDFEKAIALDPENADAKHNLEMSLARRRDISLAESAAGARPSPGGRGAKGAGAANPGSGY